MKRFHALDSFRGLCALAVAVFHLHIYQCVSELAFFRNAHYLVSFFFVLSGFVMMHTYSQRLASARQLKAFAISRVFRLYPLHVLTLLFAVGLEVAKLLAEHRGVQFAQPSFSDQRAASEIVPNLLLIQAWWPGFSAQSFNYPAWSISIEAWMYLVFAVLVLGFQRQVLPVFALLALIAFALLGTQHPLLTPMVWQGVSCFFTGALTWRLYAALRDAPVSFWVMTALEATCVTLVVLAMSVPLAHKDYALSLLFAAMVLAFAFDAGGISRLLRLAPFEALGKWSYSIYMTHSFILFFATLGLTLAGKVMNSALLVYPSDGTPPLFSLHSAALDNALLATILAVIVATAAVCYRVVECRGIEVGKYLNRRGHSAVPMVQG